ncbi:hypothetical protein [Methyloversatilis sp.]|uniref:hypothetical protein n=1 Tax=Methyloversatilis sp. TaxID=2569862 RepID=UPI003F6F3C5B
MPANTLSSASPDPTRLNDHLSQCVVALGPMHRMRCAAEAVDAFLAPRFVSLLLVMSALLLGGLSL